MSKVRHHVRSLLANDPAQIIEGHLNQADEAILYAWRVGHPLHWTSKGQIWRRCNICKNEILYTQGHKRDCLLIAAREALRALAIALHAPTDFLPDDLCTTLQGPKKRHPRRTS